VEEWCGWTVKTDDGWIVKDEMDRDGTMEIDLSPVLRRRVGKVGKLHPVDRPPLVVDVDPDLHGVGPVRFEVGRSADDGVGVDAATIGNLLHLAGLELHLDPPLLEAEAVNGEFGSARHRTDARRAGLGGVGGADDGADVKAPGVAKPTVGPAAKGDQGAGPSVVPPRAVLPSLRRCLRQIEGGESGSGGVAVGPACSAGVGGGLGGGGGGGLEREDCREARLGRPVLHLGAVDRADGGGIGHPSPLAKGAKELPVGHGLDRGEERRRHATGGEASVLVLGRGALDPAHRLRLEPLGQPGPAPPGVLGIKQHRPGKGLGDVPTANDGEAGPAVGVREPHQPVGEPGRGALVRPAGLDLGQFEREGRVPVGGGRSVAVAKGVAKGLGVGEAEPPEVAVDLA